MKLFKKLLAVTLVAVLAMSLFTACGDASGVPDSTAEMAHWQNLNNAARKYGLEYGPVLNDVDYSKELSAYTREKLNVYLELLNKGEYLGYGNDRYTNPTVKSKLAEIDARCQRETGYKCTVYMISGKDANGNMQVDYSILYKQDGFGDSSTERFGRADEIGVACIANKQDSKTYTMMECYEEIKK